MVNKHIYQIEISWLLFTGILCANRTPFRNISLHGICTTWFWIIYITGRCMASLLANPWRNEWGLWSWLPRLWQWHIENVEAICILGCCLECVCVCVRVCAPFLDIRRMLIKSISNRKLLLPWRSWHVKECDAIENPLKLSCAKPRFVCWIWREEEIRTDK